MSTLPLVKTKKDAISSLLECIFHAIHQVSKLDRLCFRERVLYLGQIFFGCMGLWMITRQQQDLRNLFTWGEGERQTPLPVATIHEKVLDQLLGSHKFVKFVRLFFHKYCSCLNGAESQNHSIELWQPCFSLLFSRFDVNGILSSALLP